MELTITSRRTQLSELMRDLIYRKANRLEEHAEGIHACRVTLEISDGACQVKINVRMRGREFNARGEGENLGKALDAGLSRIVRQMDKANKVQKDHGTLSITEASVLEPALPA